MRLVSGRSRDGAPPVSGLSEWRLRARFPRFPVTADPGSVSLTGMTMQVTKGRTLRPPLELTPPSCGGFPPRAGARAAWLGRDPGWSSPPLSRLSPRPGQAKLGGAPCGRCHDGAWGGLPFRSGVSSEPVRLESLAEGWWRDYRLAREDRIVDAPSRAASPSPPAMGSLREPHP